MISDYIQIMRPKRASLLIYLVLIVVVARTCAQNNKCSLENKQKCQVKLIEAGHDVNAPVMSFLNESDARDHCQHYDYYAACYQEFLHDCTILDRLSFDGNIAAYRWWCDQLFHVYLDHQQCFSNNKLHTKADVCQATLDEAVSLSFLYKVRGRFSEAWTIYCRAHETHLDCVEDSINEHCNDALAGKWQRGLDERNLAPTLHYERCIMGGVWELSKKRYPSVTVDEFPKAPTTPANNISTIVTTDKSTCSQVIIENCTTLLKDKGHAVNDAIVPSLNHVELRDHCRSYQQFEGCLSEKKQNCEEYESLKYDGLEKAYDWWCIEAVHEYLDNRDCFMSGHLHWDGNSCLHAMTTELIFIKGEYDSQTDERDAICSILRKYLYCIEIAVFKHCKSEQAAKWQRGFDERALWSQVRHYGCLSDDNKTWHTDDSLYLTPISEVEDASSRGDDEEDEDKDADDISQQDPDDNDGEDSGGSEDTDDGGDSSQESENNKDDVDDSHGSEDNDDDDDDDDTSQGYPDQPEKHTDEGGNQTSRGAIVGIVILALIIVILLVLMALFYRYNKRRFVEGKYVCNTEQSIKYNGESVHVSSPSNSCDPSHVDIGIVSEVDVDLSEPVHVVNKISGFENPTYGVHPPDKTDPGAL